ncbi:Metal-dependent hydrolase, endonuclease/exonuclease/phosphatase family [Lentzea xinjiangensis]|uniref:Metal-dependent hydrolase, endonuclease/exonuclease/phosphatase family n=1 Tax=Lentzea xinjiangensis TaxID=402600 RepID=A0A1H9LQJ4_9PSEU|nr:jacalin-like lectin [Lentzea xinjiangensis]SER13435.1 Metal-dependent hydrolase, endonuclease/exonuclease/phosphatase family [Lentzea xinjiangensis]
MLTRLAVAAGLVLALAVPASATPPSSGTFSVLSYNIAGLPEGLSSGNPRVNTPIIGQRIRPYDVVHVQEDFNYHASLYANNTHPFRTPTSGGVPFGDGLNTLADHPYSDLTRDRWDRCNGTDCLTPKGFSWSRIRLAEGVLVDFYNVHANAGSADADLAARRANISELSRFITANSAGNAVVVAGDTNTRYTRAGDNIRELVSANGLTDAWVQQERGGVPPAAGSPALVCDDRNVSDACEVVDKILYRGNRYIALSLSRYGNENARFRTSDDKMLSDHYPIAAELRWTLDPELSVSDVAGGPHGTPFTDVAAVPVRKQAAEVAIRTGSRVDRVGLTFADGTSFAHGGGGGTEQRLALGEGEHLRSVTLHSGRHDGRTRIFRAAFTTTAGRTLAGGTATPSSVTLTAPAGWHIAGFHGRSGEELDALGVIYARVP